MIKVEALEKSYGTEGSVIKVLRGLNLEIRDNELVAIMGSSGSGKSTLLNILGLLDCHDSGRYELAGKIIAHLSEGELASLRNRHLGFVFQSFNLLPFKTAQENVALPLYYQKVPRKVRNYRALEYLERVGLADRATHLPGELSGGQKQRVALARALITDPKVILADEPTGALDSNTSAEMMQLFKDVHAQGKTIVIVTHEDDIAAQTERVIHLKDGKIINDTAQA